jgi:hypothetical protein
MDDDDDEEEKIIPNIRERAFSECARTIPKRQRSISAVTLNRGQSHYSDSNLSQIDKEKTFAFDTRRATVMPGELLAKVVVALGGYRVGDEEEQKQASIHSSVMGIHGFSDSQILASEQNYSDWSIEASEKSYVTPPQKRNNRLRATSEIRIPMEQSVKVVILCFICYVFKGGRGHGEVTCRVEKILSLAFRAGSLPGRKI